MRRARRAGCLTAALLCGALLGVGCAGRSGLALIDSPAPDVATLVDSEPAQGLLAEILKRFAAHPRSAALPPNIPGADRVAGPPTSRRPDHAALRELAREVSVDFAALTFAGALSADQRSRAVQAAVERSLQSGAAASEALLRRRGVPYTVLFAPSWLYVSYPDTGADFASQRRLLDRLGIANRLIPTGESASVEDNAEAIAAAVRTAGREGAKLILVSASKSGAEVALALSRRLAPEEAAGVVAWVNVVGALGGSPLADSALRPPASWVTRGVFWLFGWDWAGLQSMATGPSRERLKDARLPDSIAVVNVVAVPVSGSVGPKVWWGYRILRRHGPNDGVVLLADTVWPGGANLVVLGPDHLYAPRRDDRYGVALLLAVDLAVHAHVAQPDPTVLEPPGGR